MFGSLGNIGKIFGNGIIDILKPAIKDNNIPNDLSTSAETLMTGNQPKIEDINNNTAEQVENDPYKYNENTTDIMAGAQQFEHDEAELNRKWQEEMSNTAYQRAVADMKAAGLNPAVMFASGSGTPAAVTSGSKANSTISTQENTRLQYIYGGINSASNLLAAISQFLPTLGNTKYKGTNFGFK